MKPTILLILAVVSLLVCHVIGSAQEDVQPDEGADAPEWPLPKDKDLIPVGDLISAYAEHANTSIIFDPRKLSGAAKLKPEEKGRTLKGAEIDMFVSNALESSRSTLMPGVFGTVIVPIAEAVTFAPVLTEEELGRADDWTWACVLVRLQYADYIRLANDVRFKRRDSRPFIQPASPNFILMVDRVDRLKVLVAEAREADKPTTYERHTVRDSDAAIQTLRKQFQGKGAAFTISPSGNIVVRADENLHKEIAEAVAALD